MAKVGFISLGCPKNLVDSEIMLGHLKSGGNVLTGEIREAELLIVNTCGFIESAKEESIQAILEAASMKQYGACKKLIVTGCLIERYREQILADMPEVDAVVGTREIEKILDILQSADRELKTTADPLYLYNEASPRLLTTQCGYAYIKISEGCDHFCAFCAIPGIRGQQRSRTIPSILNEAAQLVQQGVKELILVGQDTTDFGRDLGDHNALEALIKSLGKLDSLRWFRVHYTYPNRLTDSLLNAIAQTPNCCKYLDIPLQHANAKILKTMARGGSRSAFMDLVSRIRKRVPGVFIRTNFIVGFPGEGEAEFSELRNFIAEAQFDHIGVFTYSAEEGTPAFSLGDPINKRTKEKRRRILMELQQGISKAHNQALVGQTLEVIAECSHEESDLIIKGRHSGQAPEIDGNVLIVGGEVRLHDIQSVRITEAHTYDLVGVVSP
uniref:Ribosomal protein uS12 methylthiotransferase RimO n=1 Tax=uncultured bacterium contig00038 TaxID=1181526 RepID=A0A806K125_9BACT|nr:ribosomal protein S12p Asp88 methylthiotransferase [uncultured bacterium contig00038]